MEAPAPDTHAIYTRLVEVFDPEQAEVLVEVLPTEPATAGQVAELRTDMTTEIGSLRTEMTTGFAELRTEMTTGFGALRSELVGHAGRVDNLSSRVDTMGAEIKELRADMRTMLMMIDGLGARFQTFDSYLIAGLCVIVTALIGIIVSVWLAA